MKGEAPPTIETKGETKGEAPPTKETKTIKTKGEAPPTIENSLSFQECESKIFGNKRQFRESPLGEHIHTIRTIAVCTAEVKFPNPSHDNRVMHGRPYSLHKRFPICSLGLCISSVSPSLCQYMEYVLYIPIIIYTVHGFVFAGYLVCPTGSE